MNNDNNIGTISFENMKRMEARRVKVDETLLQAAEMQKMTNHTDQLISEIMRQQRSHLNKQVYDLAEQQGVSIYNICLQYMPQMSEPQLSHADDGTVTYEQGISLVPMPFEPDKGPDYWKEECCRLKKLMLELINDEEDINKAGYTHVQFSSGYPKKGDESRRMTFELKAIEYREGREEWGAEKGKKYLVEVLGRRTTLDGTKLWEG